MAEFNRYGDRKTAIYTEREAFARTGKDEVNQNNAGVLMKANKGKADAGEVKKIVDEELAPKP